MSLDAIERQQMPFVGESGGLGIGGRDADRRGAAADLSTERGPDRPPDRAGLPPDPGLTERLAEARRKADEHRGHGTPRAPRPDRMQR